MEEPSGNKSSTGVVKLILSQPQSCEINEIIIRETYLVSKSKYFEALLSEKWTPSASSSSREIKVTATHQLSYYTQCLKFMSTAKSLSFNAVGEALGVLTVAAEWLVEDIISHCLRYLEAMRWTYDEEQAIKYTLDALDVKPTSDLATRLSDSLNLEDNDHLEALREILKETLDLESMLRNKEEFKRLGSMLDEILSDFFGPQHCSPETPRVSEVTLVCRDVLRNLYAKMVSAVCLRPREGWKWDVMSYILLVSKKWDMELYRYLVESFIVYPYVVFDDLSGMPCRDFTSFFAAVLKALVQGEVLVTMSVWSMFLDKWTHAFLSPKLHNHGCSQFACVLDAKGFVDVFTEAYETLPLEEQKRIWGLWKKGVSSLSKGCPCAPQLQSVLGSINIWWAKRLRSAYLRVHSSSSAPLNKELGEANN